MPRLLCFASLALLLCLQREAKGESGATEVAAASRKARSRGHTAAPRPSFKDGLEPDEKGYAPGKDKTCCGYPLVAEGEWALRFYWMAEEEDYELHYDEHDVYTRDGLFLGRFSERFLQALRMEGTALLKDGRVINYHGSCPYGVGTCFQTLDAEEHPFGRGAGQRALVPFKSVAIDPNLVPIGEPMYIAEFDGVEMPDGSYHDGCVRADDTGGSIKKRKMDFFVASRENWRKILFNLHGHTWMTPQIEHPRCEYLRR